jgi:type IV secretory pathway TrbD component
VGDREIFFCHINFVLHEQGKYSYRSEKEKMMKNLQKIGGIAALMGAATNLLAIVMVITLGPKGLSSNDPGQSIAFFAENLAILRAWYLIIYLVFGVSLIFLSLALYERLKAGSPALVQVVTTIGLIWAVLVLVMGTLSINDLSTVVKLYGENPAQAATVWVTLKSVETGLGNNGGETFVNAIWFLLLSWTALRARELPRGLNYLGLVTGAAGILSVVFQPALAAVYGVGLIIWFVWLGVVLLRRSTSEVVYNERLDPTFTQISG